MSDARDWARWWRLRGQPELRALLFEQWDPLGIADDEDWPRDEYDSYATALASQLRRGDSRADIARYLSTALLETPPTPQGFRSAEATADSLIAWYPSSGAPEV